MPYNQNVPQANQQIKATQLDILNNFINIQSIIGVDHVTFGSANEGKHNKSTYVPQTDHPAVNNQATIYNFGNELYIKKNGALSVAGTNFTLAGLATNGWTRLPSNILIKWGSIAGVTINTTNVVNFNTGGGIPAFSAAPYTVFAINSDLTANDNIAINMGVITSATQFEVFPRRIGAGGAATCTIKWIAIGV